MSQAAWYERFGQIGKRLSLAERHYERGLYYYGRKKYDLATADLDEAIELEPKRAEFYVARGLMLLLDNRPDEAEEDFEYGLKLDRTQWLAHYGRGIRAFEKGDYAGAIDGFSRAQRIAPDRPEVYYYRALAFYQMENSSEAVNDMTYAENLLAANDKRRKQTQKWRAIFEA
ncbi:MAG: tetratricopeptide repeat protein [Anaerolineae bacterium]|nr:tetratricopeptide repeat protein [Anaerolineae bacterium]